MATFIASPNFYVGRRRPLTFIVWHSTESQETVGAAAAIARNWFGQRASQVSAHIVADAATVVECVKPENTAWHCARGNAAGYGVEIVGQAAQTGPDWRDAYSLAAIRNACDWIRDLPALNDIPARWLTDAQLRAGEKGLTTHLQVSRVLGGTNHSDPGGEFPLDFVLQELGGAEPATPDAGTYCRMGDRCERVLRLQQFMVRVFGSYNRYIPTSYYGASTRDGIAEFQRRTGVTGPDADGTVVGPRTLTQLAAHGFQP